MAGETKGKHKQKKAAANLSKKDSSKRPENKSSNPFEAISGGQQRRAKFDIVGRKAKGSTKNVGEAVKKAVAQRQQSLLVEFRQQGKVNSFVDKRFGEKDGSKTEEDKALERFKKERTKRMGKTSRYQLEDGEEGEQLTHMGRALSEVSALGAPSLPQEEEDEDEDEDEAAGRLGADLVTQSHFGGGPLDILAEREKRLARQQEARERAKAESDQNRGDKTKRQIMEEIILKSKQHKQEKKVMNAEQMDLVDTLDDSFTDIRNLLEFRNKGKKGPATSEEKGQEEEGEKDSDYAALSNQLAADIKAKAGDRLKTDEEQAKEERQRLETLEKERQKRMRMGLEGAADDADDNELDRALDAATAAANRTVGRPKGILRTNDDELDGNFEVDPQFAARDEDEDEEGSDMGEEDEAQEKGTKRGKEEEVQGKNKRAKKVEFSAKEDRLLASKEQDILRMQQEIAGGGASSELSADLSALTDNGLPMVKVKEPLLEEAVDEEDEGEGDEGDQIGEGDWGEDDDEVAAGAKPAKAAAKVKEEPKEKEAKKAKTSAAPSSPKIITITSKASLAKKAEEAKKAGATAGEGAGGIAGKAGLSLDIPYIIDAPKTYPEFRSLIEGRNREETAAIMSRIVSSNHISLAAENRQKMERFYVILLQHFHACCSSAYTPGGEVCLGRVDDTSKQLYLLSQMMPHYTGQCMRVHLRQMRTRIMATRGSTSLTVPDLLFFKLIATIFPTSDFRHNVVSPTLVWMGELLTNTPVHGARDVACLLLLCTLQLHFVHLSRRVLPELFAFLKSLLATACHVRGAIPETSEDNLLHTFAGTGDLAVDFLSFSPSTTEAGAPSTVKTESGSESGAEPRKGLKLSLLFGKENPDATETSAELRRELMHSTLSVIEQALTTYHNQTQSFPELFGPLFQILAIANKKRDESQSGNKANKAQASNKAGKGKGKEKEKETKTAGASVDAEEASLWQRVEELQARYQSLRKSEVALRKPLVMETAMLPPTIKQFTPEFKETYIPGKDYDPKVERAEMKKFSKKINREKRGAVRELRRDTEFIAREKSRIQAVKQTKLKEKKKEIRKELEQAQRDTNVFGKMGKKSKGKK